MDGKGYGTAVTVVALVLLLAAAPAVGWASAVDTSTVIPVPGAGGTAGMSPAEELGVPVSSIDDMYAAKAAGYDRMYLTNDIYVVGGTHQSLPSGITLRIIGDYGGGAHGITVSGDSELTIPRDTTVLVSSEDFGGKSPVPEYRPVPEAATVFTVGGASPGKLVVEGTIVDGDGGSTGVLLNNQNGTVYLGQYADVSINMAGDGTFQRYFDPDSTASPVGLTDGLIVDYVVYALVLVLIGVAAFTVILMRR